MPSAQVVETSVTNNCSSQNYSHPYDHTIRTITSFVFEDFQMLTIRHFISFTVIYLLFKDFIISDAKY